jgi:hypothetical protein
MTDLFDGRLEKHGVREATEYAAPTHRCLTDGENNMPVSSNGNGVATWFSRYAGTDPTRILAAVHAEFDVEWGTLDDL